MTHAPAALLQRRLLIPAGLSLLLAATAIRGSDEPHWQANSIQCNSCHDGHSAAGSQLTNVAGNDNLCRSCHNDSGTALNFSMARMAVANLTAQSGSSHAWGVSAVNATAGASTPTNPQMSLRLSSGKVMCSTCHDQHSSPQNADGSVKAASAGTQYGSPVIKTQGSGGGTVTFSRSATANPKAYLIEIVAGGATGTATFRLSNDGGVSWFGWNGTSWVTYAGNPRATSASVALNDGSNVTVTFSGTFSTTPLPDRYKFHVAYPFLRTELDSGDNSTGAKFCRDCHSAWSMDHTGTRTWDGSYRSHPVGVALNANGGGYDRGTPLDGNGAPQGGAGVDSNSTNDLKLDSGGRVQCFTCHGMHHADGNTQTVDTP